MTSLTKLNNTQRDYMNAHCLGYVISFYDKNQAQRTGVIKRSFVKNGKLYIRVACYEVYNVPVDNVII